MATTTTMQTDLFMPTRDKGRAASPLIPLLIRSVLFLSLIIKINILSSSNSSSFIILIRRADHNHYDQYRCRRRRTRRAPSSSSLLLLLFPLVVIQGTVGTRGSFFFILLFPLYLQKKKQPQKVVARSLIVPIVRWYSY